MLRHRKASRHSSRIRADRSCTKRGRTAPFGTAIKALSQSCVYTDWHICMESQGVVVSMGTVRRLVQFLTVFVLGLVLVHPSGGQARHAQRGLARAADTTFAKGAQAKLPPHISTLLGLSNERECPVMQSVTRNGSRVQGLDVSVANQNDVVLFVVDETGNDQDLYLTSPEGNLRKVVSVKGGVGRTLPIADKDRSAFQKEKQFWIDRLDSSASGK